MTVTSSAVACKAKPRGAVSLVHKDLRPLPKPHRAETSVRPPLKVGLRGFRELIAGADDARFNVLYVSKGGDVGVYALPDEGEDFYRGLDRQRSVRFRFSVRCPGGRHFGTSAAADEKYVRELFEKVARLWENPAALREALELRPDEDLDSETLIDD